MLYVRVISIATGAAALLWWALFPAQIRITAFQHLEIPPPGLAAGAVEALMAQLPPAASFGLFPSSAEIGEAPDATKLRLQGTFLTPGRQAALISVAGAKPHWIALGAPTDGLEVVELRTGSALVRTSSGDTVSLEMFKRAPDAKDDAARGNGNAPS